VNLSARLGKGDKVPVQFLQNSFVGFRSIRTCQLDGVGIQSVATLL